MNKRDQATLGPEQFRVHALPLSHMEMPGAGVVHLWYLDLGELATPFPQPGGDAPSGYTPRHERTIRRFYLRLLLGAYLRLPGRQVSVSRKVKGKPVLDGNAHTQAMDFSMAASGGCCLIGVASTGLIGIDLELAGRRAINPVGLARRYFSAPEAGAFDNLGGKGVDDAFLHTWACKEAVVKAAGHGIANQLNRFSVSTDPGKRPRVLHMEDDDASAWQLATVRPSARHLGAVALRHGNMRLEGFRLVPGVKSRSRGSQPG